MNDKLEFARRTRKLENSDYRKLYDEERRPVNYSPIIHVGFNLGTLISVVVINFLMIQNWSLKVLPIFAFIFLFGNVVVYFVHRYPLHKRLKLWSFPYDSHTVEHHRFFTSDHITYRDSKDFYAAFFPSFVIAGYAMVVSPFFYFSTKLFLGSDLAHAYTGAAAGYFLLYEFFHWASHLPINHPLMKIGWIKMMREHHRAHHNPKLMHKYNFGIVYPMMDILMGTRYVEKMPADLPEDHYSNVIKNAEPIMLKELNGFNEKC